MAIIETDKLTKYYGKMRGSMLIFRKCDFSV